MDSEDEPNTSDTSNIPLESSLTFNSLCNNYLQENISASLSQALTYVILYRPDDPIEFIANFLIDWSRKKSQLHLIEEQKEEIKHLFTEHNEEKQEIDFQKAEHSLPMNGKKSYMSVQSDDDGKLLNHFQEQQQQQQAHQTNTQQHVHTHDTASGFDDEIKNNQETNKTHLCHDGNLSSFTYFSKLRDKIIKCDEF